MTGAGFILAINLFVAGLLAASFAAIAAYDRRREAARWLALSYAIGMSNFLIEFAIATVGTSTLLVMASYGALLAALSVFNIGIARKYAVPVPLVTLCAISMVALVTCYFIQDLSRQSFMRMLLYQSPFFVLQAIAAGIVAQSKGRTALDNMLLVLLAASALQFLSKPLLFRAFGGTGDSPDQYLSTIYAMFSQSMGTVFAMALALLLLVILVRDVLSDAHARSETDTMSGLLNRGGFETHASVALHDARRLGLPVSLVIADLDHFKSINDNFGHAAGDAVIVTFSGFLRSAMAPHHVAGRVGGEEFAILMPGTNLVAARLFAEGARNAFASMAVEGLPSTKRFTSSFGVAELARGEGIGDLMARADKALYLAKNSGRDCVKIAPRPGGRRSDDDSGAAISLT
ncbi:GGDEF domain-containing protein [Mesorhizobium marinum]|uniref:diguanylate cyclase n=1 Tax=Mesorhizobium marinum TaxID=3228790 RepID=A0ABV3QXN4_9HYPH